MSFRTERNWQQHRLALIRTEAPISIQKKNRELFHQFVALLLLFFNGCKLENQVYPRVLHYFLFVRDN